MMESAEKYVVPIEGRLGTSFPKKNDFREVFYLRWGRISFDVHWGIEMNLKVLIKVYRADNTCELYLVDTEAYDIQWNLHKRATRDFFVLPYSNKHGKATCIKFAYIVHLRERSIPSQQEYIFAEGHHLDHEPMQTRPITHQWSTPNTYRTYELQSEVLQKDVDWYNQHYESLHLIPKFTKGQLFHPYHPKRFIHDHIDKVLRNKQNDPQGLHTIKVCVDCIDDADFITHLLHASQQGVWVQCIVDWRKMTLTNSENYARLKRSGIELIGSVCTPHDPLIEVAPDMHNKFIIFDNEDVILGSFNITFDRWWANWESGMTFHSQGIGRLLDNIFQSIRGGVIQRYGIDPLSHFNLLYTFGRHAMLSGRYYRPHHAILSEIHRARRSIKVCLFLIGELLGDHHDSVIDALIHAKHRGVDVQLLLNGHLARQGDPGKEYTMAEELRRPLLPAVLRLKHAGIPVYLAYGQNDTPVPYSPIHSKYCIIDDYIVIEGSFNWYNTSVFSHDLVIVAANGETAKPYLYEFHQILRTFRIFQ